MCLYFTPIFDHVFIYKSVSNAKKKSLFDKLLIQYIYSPSFKFFFLFPIFLMNIDMNLAMVGLETYL